MTLWWCALGFKVPHGRSGAKESARRTYFWPVFLALALDLILSACRFLASSLSSEAAAALSSSHEHCQFGHLRTCAQAIQSDTLVRAKKLSNVFIIITFCPIVSPLDHLSLSLLLLSLRNISDLPHLPFLSSWGGISAIFQGPAESGATLDTGSWTGSRSQPSYARWSRTFHTTEHIVPKCAIVWSLILY